MKAWHNNPEVKDFYVSRMRAHIAADQLIRGVGWNSRQHKGCAVGCTLHSYHHAAYETELGWPEELAHLEDTIFENLPNGEHIKWPLQLMEAVPVGVDLASAMIRIKVRILREVGWYPQQAKRDRWGVMDAIDGIVTALESGIGVEEAESAVQSVMRIVWATAVRAPESAAESAAAAAESAAWSAWVTALRAPESAAESAESAAESAAMVAWSVERAAASASGESERAVKSAAESERAVESAAAERAAGRAAKATAWRQIRDIVLEEVAR